MVELVKVTGCKDGHRWYSGYVGMSFVRLKDFISPPGTSEWKVRTLDGHSNFIRCCDGEIVESLPLEETEYNSPDLRELILATEVFQKLLKRNLIDNLYYYKKKPKLRDCLNRATNHLDMALFLLKDQ